MLEGMHQINSATWFKTYYERVTDKDWPEEWRPVEVLQQPNETVFVPNGWPHLVLNLELTVAVTHNYASEFGPFERMWEEVQVEENEFSQRWYSGLKTHRPDLVERLSKNQKMNISSNKK
jgi:histone arginine demethylase JMJD6